MRREQARLSFARERSKKGNTPNLHPFPKIDALRGPPSRRRRGEAAAHGQAARAR